MKVLQALVALLILAGLGSCMQHDPPRPPTVHYTWVPRPTPTSTPAATSTTPVAEDEAGDVDVHVDHDDDDDESRFCRRHWYC